MKKIVSLLLAGALTLSLAACGGDTTSDVSGTSGANGSGSSETPSDSAQQQSGSNCTQQWGVGRNPLLRGRVSSGKERG